MTGQKMYTLLECDPSRFGLGGSTEDIGMITLDIILWVGVQSSKMTFPVPNDKGGWGHQHGKKSPKALLPSWSPFGDFGPHGDQN